MLDEIRFDLVYRRFFYSSLDRGWCIYNIESEGSGERREGVRPVHQVLPLQGPIILKIRV